MGRMDFAHRLPDVVLESGDWVLDDEAVARMHTVVPGDAVSDYFGSPEVQRDMLARERAAERLGLNGVRGEVALEPAVLETHVAMDRLQGVILASPLQYASHLSERTGNAVYCKLENMRPPAFTFKDRGAFNKVASLDPNERARGVWAVSTGNHAQGVALAARHFGVPATIFMPVTTPMVKQNAVKAFGADVVLAGENFSEALAFSKESPTSAVFVHPFDDPEVIAGQGTLAIEILEQYPDLSHLFVPIGGGGLISGIGQYIKTVRPDVKVIGIEPDDSNCAQEARRAGRPVTLEEVGTFADSLTVKQVGDHTHARISQYVDDLITVGELEIREAMRDIASDTRTITEPSGAVGMAGLLRYVRQTGITEAGLVTVCSGGNIDFERFKALTDLG